MPKKQNIDAKTFEKEVSTFQDRIFYSNRGKGAVQAAASLGVDVDKQDVAVIHAVMTVHNNDLVDLGWAFVPIPVELLFCLITPFSAETFLSSGKGSCTVNYMSELTKTSIQKLCDNDILLLKGHREGQCRQFGLGKEFARNYYLAQADLLYKVQDNYKKEEFMEYCLKPAPRGSGFEYADRVHPWSIATVDKLKNSRFVFDAMFYHSKEGKDFIRSQKLNKEQDESLLCALEFINNAEMGAQYHESFHLQQAGRMHTVGGIIQMPKWFRDRFILPVDKNNERLEMDLKCAQLIILCDYLELPELKELILDILDREGSIWHRIGDQEMLKKIKKIIVYAFCFGGALANIPFMASKEARANHLPNCSVTKADVDSCLNGILKPLVDRREEWLQDYTVQKIIKSRGSRVIENALGYPFPIYKTAVDLAGKKLNKKIIESTKVGSQLLAHIAQGKEQYVMQDLIANYIDLNILAFQYDGLTLEVAPNQIEEIKSCLITASTYPLEFSIPKI